MNDKGQIHTLEGFAAAILIVLALIFAVQSVGLTVTSSTTASGEVQSQTAQMAKDVLTRASIKGDLKDAILRWNNNTTSFQGSGNLGYYEGGCTCGTLGTILGETLSNRGYAYNIELIYKSEAGPVKIQPFVHNGDPTDDAVTVTKKVVLYDGDQFNSPTPLRLDNDTHTYPDTQGFFRMEDAETSLYNVVEVRLTVWQK